MEPQLPPSSLQQAYQPQMHQPLAAHQNFIAQPQQANVQHGNPLMRHFRQPVLYISLTSKGLFWPDGTLDLPVSGEIPVYPMTAKDEIVLKTPDALINGTSVVQVIQSCCPNIKNAWEMPSIDVDSTLIAIRIASYGQNMPVSAKCPHCGEEHDYDINLADVKDQIVSPNYGEPIVTKDGLVINLRPLSYAKVSKANTMALEEDKIVESMADPLLTEEARKIEYDKHIKKIVEINIANATDCTRSIIADGIEVSDPKFIMEYYQNVESQVLWKIQSRVKEFAATVGIKPQPTFCSACNGEFKLNVEFDYSHFFGNGF